VNANLHTEESTDRKGPPAHAYDCTGWPCGGGRCGLSLGDFARGC
jgi:hypothetical protein